MYVPGSDAADMATQTIAADAHTLARAAADPPPNLIFSQFTNFPGPFFLANWRLRRTESYGFTNGIYFPFPGSVIFLWANW